MNKSGNIGTATETAVVKVFAARGMKGVERRRLRGKFDAGDLFGVPRTLVEVKGGHAAERASDAQVETWLDRAHEKLRPNDMDRAVLIMKRKGIGLSNAASFWAVWREQYEAGEVTLRATLTDWISLYKAGRFLVSDTD